MFSEKTALLLVDIQHDFCKNGSLAVEKGDEVVLVANQLMPLFSSVIATQDWHPENHASFESLWPVHCVAETQGAELHRDLEKKYITEIFKKGTDTQVDSYSAFYDNDQIKKTGLTEWLQKNDIETVYIMGLATDYCVKFSCLDAIKDGFSVHIIQDGCRGVNIQQNDSEIALLEMKSKGATLIHSTDLFNKKKCA